MGAVIEPSGKSRVLNAEDLSFVLRCYVAPRNDKYVAECVDLDLMTRADTPEAAMGKMAEAIIGYLKVALEGDRDGLVPRPSPFSHRLYYHYLCFLASFTSRKRNFRLFDWSPSFPCCA